MTSDDEWRSAAAYLYCLGLDAEGEAWECLRRNPTYRADCAGLGRGVPTDWGLAAFEDPSRDARDAEPIWLDAPSSLALVPALSGGAIFDLWSLPAPRRIIHDGKRLRALVGEGLRVELAPTLRSGRPLAYQIRAADGFAQRSAMATIAALERPPRRRSRPAQRDALVRMRTFAAYDGHAAGASHRDIALVLFGRDAVRSGWTDDGALRAQVRHLVARGRRLVGGGYRALLDPGGSRRRALSPSPAR